jgi:retron-type reverse transcriptase
MKRINHLFDAVTSYQNIRLGFLKAIRGKRSSPAVVLFCKDVTKNLETIRCRLQSAPVEWGPYRHFSVTDPKPRTISAVPFEDRVIHHALMNVLEAFFERPLIDNSYACRKGKGTQKAVLYAFSRCKASTWFLKLDVRKYFDSIDHTVLKRQLARMFKDERVLLLLFSIIDSYQTENGKGLPIGNLTSQYFANLYLSPLDHYILEHLKPAAYVRYMDDMVLWDEPCRLRASSMGIQTFLHERLALSLKQSLIGQTAQGLPFLGYLLKPKGIYLSGPSKQRIKNHAFGAMYQFNTGLLTEEQAAMSLQSVFVPALLARSTAFRLRLLRSRFWLEPGPSRRQLEQQRREPAFGQSEQQHPNEPEQQQRFSACPSLSPAKPQDSFTEHSGLRRHLPGTEYHPPFGTLASLPRGTTEGVFFEMPRMTGKNKSTAGEIET